MTETTATNIIQLTNVEADERYYLKSENGITAYAPSWTHILSTVWPPSKGLEMWRGDVGNERAEEIMVQAGEQGTFVHNACESILNGSWISADDVRTTFPRAKALKPLRCLAAFLDFCEQFEPEPDTLEGVTWLDDPPVAGTIDFRGTINKPVRKGNKIIADPSQRVYGLLDWKSSKALHDNHKAQVAGYTHSEERAGRPVDMAGLLHLGNATKSRWSLCDLTPDLEKWTEKALNAVHTFHLHHPNARPSDEQFPETFALPGTSVE